MNFEEVILNLANQTAIDRTANVGTGYRGTKNTRELLLTQKKIFLNEKDIERRFNTHEEDFDIKRFFVYMILHQGDYSINEDVTTIDKVIISYRKYLIDNEKYIHWDKKNKEMYEIVLETVLEDKIPPTINLDNPDEEMDLDFIPNKKREKVVNYAMSNSFGFGGHNAVIVFKKYKE